MKLSKLRALTSSLLLISFAIAIVAYFSTEQGSMAYTVSTIVVILLFCVALCFIFIWGRCPHC